MVTLETAENALKNVYLGVVSNQLNVNANPLLNKIKQSTSDVWGKEIRKLAPYGLNGGIGAGEEQSLLPKAGSNKYVQFVSTLKNLYGTIEISDKAIRASEHNSGAFVNLLNAEMEGLIKASSFNFGRMLYGDGSGYLAKIVSIPNSPSKNLVVDSTRNLMEGMIVDVYAPIEEGYSGQNMGNRIVAIDRKTNTVTMDHRFPSPINPNTEYLVIQQSAFLELTGLGSVFGNDSHLYGVKRSDNPWMNPYKNTSTGEINDVVIQEAIDELEEVAGSTVDFITCSSKVKRLYQSYLSSFRRNIDVMELNGGYKAMSYNGIPLVSDRFVEDDAMYLLNTKEFTLHQLCDWQWLEGENGKVIRQIAGYPTYSATLVKYADLICDKPSGQAKLSGIKASVDSVTETPVA